MKEEIEKALQCLLGLPLWRASRASDLQSFQFGDRRIFSTRRGGIKEVGEYALHVLCAWRIAGKYGIVVASRDRYYPAGNPDEFPPDFEWDCPGANRGDERVAALFSENVNFPLTVEAIQADSAGSIYLTLSGGYKLEVFPDDSLPGEHWRLFQPSTETEHFVITGLGIE